MNLHPTRSELCRAVRRLPDTLPVLRPAEPGGTQPETLRLLPSDRHLLGILAGEADAESWALPASAEKLRDRLSIRELAKLAGCGRRTIHRCLARLEAVDLLRRDRAAWLPSRYLLQAERLVTESATWLQQQAAEALERARRFALQNPFRAPDAGAEGSAAARRVREAPELAPEQLAQLAPALETAQPADLSDPAAWQAWALGQADALLRSHGAPRWAQSRACREPVQFARVVLAWCALRRPNKAPSWWWDKASAHARSLWPLWRGIQERSAEDMVWSLTLVWWAFHADQIWDYRRRGQHSTSWQRVALPLQEWLRHRPNRWEAALEQAESAWKRYHGAEEVASAEMCENDGIDADFEGEVLAAEPVLPPPAQRVEPKPEDLVTPAELVRQALQDLPRFRLEQQQLVDQVVKQPAGKMRSSSLRANLKLLEQAPAEPRRWVVVVLEQALKQAQELRVWLLEKQRPAG